MPGRSDLFRITAILVLVVAVVASLVAVGRRPETPAIEHDPMIASPAPDGLSAELRRCGALGPTDAEDARCLAVWEENRRRFLGRPARPLPALTPPGTAAPVTPAAGDAR